MIYGPYETENDAIADAADVFDASVPWSAPNAAKIRAACAAASVELGAYDNRVIDWLARWEPQMVQVVVGLIK